MSKISRAALKAAALSLAVGFRKDSDQTDSLHIPNLTADRARRYQFPSTSPVFVACEPLAGRDSNTIFAVENKGAESNKKSSLRYDIITGGNYEKDCAESSKLKPQSGQKNPGAGIVRSIIIADGENYEIYVLATESYAGRLGVFLGGALNPEEKFLEAVRRESTEELFSSLTPEIIQEFGLEESREKLAIEALERLKNNTIYQKLSDPNSIPQDPWAGKTEVNSYTRYEFVANPLLIKTAKEKMALGEMLADMTLIGKAAFEKRAEIFGEIKKQNSDKTFQEVNNEVNALAISDYSEAQRFGLIRSGDLNYDKLPFENMTTKQAAAFLIIVENQEPPSNKIKFSSAKIAALQKAMEHFTPEEMAEVRKIKEDSKVKQDASDIIATVNAKSIDVMTINQNGQIEIVAEMQGKRYAVLNTLEAIKGKSGMTMADAMSYECNKTIAQNNNRVVAMH